MTVSRLFALLLIGALVYGVYHGKLSNLVAGGAKVSHAPAGDNPTLIRSISQRILVPLESGRAPTTASAEQALAEATAQVNARPNTSETNNCRRALALLSAALTERESILKQAMAKAPENALDKVPGVWHDAQHRDKVIDLPASNRNFRSSYWTGTALAQWRSRCAYYSSAVDAALSGR